MPLTKSKGNMYPWVTHTHTHLAGECPHKCTYCYVQAMARRFGQDRYQGEPRLVESELRISYGAHRTIFVEHCADLWAESMPDDWITSVLTHCRSYPNNEYVFQSKHPGRFLDWQHQLPLRRLLGTTIESSDKAACAKVSSAPGPIERSSAIQVLRERGERVFVTVEPILKGDMVKLGDCLKRIRPEFVNIGADSKGAGLDEPSGNDVRALLKSLEVAGIEIRQKRNLDRLLTKRPELMEVALGAKT